MTRIRFAVGSCQYPGGILDKDPAYGAYARLADRLSAEDRPQLLLLVGDQVYVDATAGLFDPRAMVDRFNRPYKLLYQQRPVAAIGNQLDGVYCMMDDHELVDNWEPIKRPDGRVCLGDLAKGVAGYIQWERAQGPDVPEQPKVNGHEPLWFEFDRDPVKFFVADTRSEREPRDAYSVETARIMGGVQFGRLCDWLETNPLVPKVVACPSIVLPRRIWARGRPGRALRSDAWDGYPASLKDLLQHIATNDIQNVIFVSGDEHISCVARIELEYRQRKTIAYSVHSSPLYGPYPFANSVDEDLVGNESFRLGNVNCTVETSFADCGDAFAIVSVGQVEGQWQFDCEFSGARATRNYRCTRDELKALP